MTLASIIQSRTSALINAFVHDTFPPLVEVDDVKRPFWARLA